MAREAFVVGAWCGHAMPGTVALLLRARHEHRRKYRLGEFLRRSGRGAGSGASLVYHQLFLVQAVGHLDVEGDPAPNLYLARLYLRQVFALGPAADNDPDDLN